MQVPLALLAALALPSGVDDPYEENDTCADAAPLSVIADGTLQSFSFVSSGAASPSGADDDWFRVDVPADRRIQVSVEGSFPGGPGVDVFLYRGQNCGTLVDSGFVAGTPLTGFNDGVAVEPFFIEIRPVDPAFVSEVLFLRIRIDDAPCMTIAPDVFEPNNSLATATLLAPGIQRGLTIHEQGDLDMFEVVVPTGDALVIGYGSNAPFSNPATCVVRGTWSNGDINNMATIVSQSGLQRIVNTSAVDRLWVRVSHIAGHPTAPCDTYDLFVATEPTPCSGGPDQYEGPLGNHDFSTATVVTPGTYIGAWTGWLDIDTYAVDVPAGEGLRWTVTSSIPGKRVAAMLYTSQDPNQSLGGSAESTGAPADVVHANTGAVPQRVWIKVTAPTSAGTLDCAPYTFALASQADLVTGVHCPGTDLGSGPIRIGLFGSADPLGTGLFVVPEGIPAGPGFAQSMLFIGLPAQPLPTTPGTLCLSAPVGRWLGYGSHLPLARDLDPLLLTAFTGTTAVAQQVTFTGSVRALSNAVTFVVP